MSALKSECDASFSESLFASYYSVNDPNPKSSKCNYSSLEYLIPDAKWWLNHPRGLKTIPERQLIDEYYSCTKNDGSCCFDMLSNILLIGSDSCDHMLSEGPMKACSEPDSHWAGLDRTGPWWHAVDKNDFTSSPGNGSMSVEKVSDSCEIYFSHLEYEKNAYVSDQMECLPPELDGSSSGQDSSPHSSEGLTRTQLVEALCHSQTRARKAEKLAQDACDDKDKITNLFLQQASCLFAYRQWLRLLQLESLCLRLDKGPDSRRNGSRAPRTKRAKMRCRASKGAIAFAVGFGLASLGLFVGWTVGWLFPVL